MKYTQMPMQLAIYMRYLHQDKGVPISQLVTKYRNYSKSNIYRHAKISPSELVADKRKRNKGRPKLLKPRDERRLTLQLLKLRATEGSYTSRRLQVLSGLSHISNRTVRRCLNASGYEYLQSRKKGRLSAADLKTRLKYARYIVKNFAENVWCEEVSFYLDAKSFAFKSNPYDQAICPQSREWRKKSEGLKLYCTGKGQKVGSGGKVVHFMVAISYGCGVINCEQYEKMSGEFFKSYVRKNFKNMFVDSCNPSSKLFLQDGDPSQNCKAAQQIWQSYGCELLQIPARSPDMNPIENVFNIAETKLKEQAVRNNITKETYEQFVVRARDILMNTPITVIDKIIDTMPKRMNMIIQKKGERLKY